MVLTAVRGGLGFLTRLPIGHDEDGWRAFRQTPAAFPLAAYPIGILLVLPLLLPLEAPAVAILFVIWLYVVTGVNHADGLGDLGDALVVHGTPADRRAVMQDTTAGIGAVLALGIVLIGLVLAGDALAREPLAALGVVVAAEVGAKLGMAAIVCLGTASHSGLGSELTRRVGPRSVLLPTAVALPAVALTGRHPAAAAALVGSLAGAALVFWWARRRLGGVGGDVLGASNEVARLVGLHVGVIVWMHW